MPESTPHDAPDSRETSLSLEDMSLGELIQLARRGGEEGEAATELLLKRSAKRNRAALDRLGA
jgi:hypothetical protein